MTQHIITVTITVPNPQDKAPDAHDLRAIAQLIKDLPDGCLSQTWDGVLRSLDANDIQVTACLSDLQAEVSNLKHIMDMVAIDMVNEDLSPTQLDTLAEQLTTAAARIRA